VIEDCSTPRRERKPLVELVGYGTSADAYHMTSGPEDGAGAAAPCNWPAASRLCARRRAASECHSTSTTVGDRGELAAIKAVFGSASASRQRDQVGHRPSVGRRRRPEAISRRWRFGDQVARDPQPRKP